MRKETSNQFTEGLVCDLNPINTPNTVLTDALNATLITYDGNEFSLQNDRGNYPLENCKLKPNYIPVGLKEYGDILYIVSYNPLNNHVEIGTYPSPVDIIGNESSEPEIQLNSVIEQITEPTDYSKLVEWCKTVIFSNCEEDTKLYPGDEYKLDEVEKSPYKYETLEYLIIDENRQKENITDLIELDDEWHSVAWQLPGWLAAQYRIATFDDFIMSVRSMEIPNIGKGPVSGTLKLNFQLRISDRLFLPNTDNDVKSDLFIRLKYLGKTVDIPLSKGEFVDWYKDSKILWFDVDVKLENLNFGKTITFNATPVLKIGWKAIIYNDFKETYSFHLNSIGDYSDFTLGDEIWKFYIDEDDTKNLYIEYNVTGPNVTKSAIQLYYKVWDLNGEEINGWKPVENYTGITNQGVGILPFDGGFESEAMYVLEFCFSNDIPTDPDITIKKLVIASQIFSEFIGEYNNYNDITFDTWVGKYKNSIKSTNWSGTYSVEDSETPYRNFEWKDGELYINGKRLSDAALSNLWSSIDTANKGVLTDLEYENLKDTTLTLIQGTENEATVSIENDLNVLKGKLWNNTPDITVDITSPIDKVQKPYERSSKIPTSLVVNDFEVISGQTKTYNYLKQQTFKHASGIENIEKVPILYLYVTPGRKNANQRIETSIYMLGDYDANRGDKLVINKDNPTKQPLINDYYIWSGYNRTPNIASNAIMSGLGTSQFAVMILVADSKNTGAGKFQIRHGNNTILSSAGKDDSDNHIYTYLVFRQNSTSKTPIFIPISHDENLWDCSTGEDDKENLLINTDALSAYITRLCENIRICTQKNAVKNGNLIKIQEQSTNNLPICNINVYTPGFDSWLYKISDKESIDLLRSGDRNKIIKNLSQDSQDICGKLLTGSVAHIDPIEFYKTEISNVNPKDVEFTVSETDKTTVQAQIETINSQIKVIESDHSLVEKIENRANSKGVYWMGGLNPELIDLLDNSYAYSESKTLIAQSTNTANLDAYVTNDKDGIVYGLVDTNITGKLDG